MCNDSVVPIKNRKALALFSYLAWIAPRGESRERIAGLLWSESDEHSARASLRQTLRQLRLALDQQNARCLHVDRTELRLDASMVSIDIRRVMDNVQLGQVGEELVRTDRIADTILYGYEDLDPMFRSWLLVQRKAIEDRLVSDLEIFLSDDGNRFDENTRKAATALGKIDPSNELACRSLMHFHARAGDLGAALRCYNELWRLLEDEFDIEPSQDTQELVAEIKSGAYEAAIVRSPVSPPVGRDIAATPKARHLTLHVLPFDREEAAPMFRHVVRGMRMDLIARLIRFREWSVFDFDNEDPVTGLDAGIGGDVDVYEVEGTAFPEDDQVRLVITLKDRQQKHFIWSDWFYLNSENWFETQSAVVRRLAIAMNIHLSAERLTRFAATSEIKPKLYDRWLAGQELSFRWRPSTEVEAERIFHDIIDEAPDFAPAYSSLVQIINSRHLIFPGIFRSTSREVETLDLAKTAVMVDPLDSRTHLCLAWSNALNKYFSRAELSFRLACDLNENDPWSLVSASLGLAFCGDIELACKLADRALDVGLGASRLHWGYQTCVRFLEGDYERSVEAADKAQDMMLGLPAWKASALFHLGRREEACEEARRFLHLVREKWTADEPPTDEAIMNWFMHLYPIRQQKQWERLRLGLAGAGVPVPDTDAFERLYPD